MNRLAYEKRPFIRRSITALAAFCGDAEKYWHYLSTEEGRLNEGGGAVLFASHGMHPKYGQSLITSGVTPHLLDNSASDRVRVVCNALDFTKRMIDQSRKVEQGIREALNPMILSWGLTILKLIDGLPLKKRTRVRLEGLGHMLSQYEDRLSTQDFSRDLFDRLVTGMRTLDFMPRRSRIIRL